VCLKFLFIKFVFKWLTWRVLSSLTMFASTHSFWLTRQGSGLIKAGLVGHDTPQLTWPAWYGRTRHPDAASVGRIKYSRIMSSTLDDEVLIGNKVKDHRGLCVLRSTTTKHASHALRYPAGRHGIDRWDDLRLIWSAMFRELDISPQDVASPPPPASPRSTPSSSPSPP
jgi:actin-related protein